MKKLKQIIQQFCIACTGGLICMVTTTLLLSKENTSIDCKSLMALLFISILSILLLQALWFVESKSKLGYWVRFILHYVGTTFLILGTGRKLSWLGLDENRNIPIFLASITIIYGIIAVVMVSENYQMAHQINEAIIRHHHKNKI